MHRDGEDSVISDIVECGVDGHIRRVGFGAAGEISRALGDGDSRFGHADAFGEVPAGLRDDHGSGISVADVFARKNRQSATNKAWIFAGIEHAGDPVECGVGVGASD